MKCKPKALSIITRTLLVMSCLLILSGCWNSRELDELGIAVAIGIDKNDDNQYKIAVQVINPSEIATDAPTTRPPVSTYTTTGETIFEAFRLLAKKSPRKIYFSQLRLAVLSSEVAEEGIMPILDFLYRDHEFRTSFYAVVAKNASAESILSIITPYEKIPANKVMSSIDTTEKNWGAAKGVSIDKLISAIKSKGENPVLSGINLIGEEELGTNISNVENVDAPTKLEIDYLAMFKDDKLVGWLTEEQSRGLNFVTGNINSAIITEPCDDGKLSIEILRSQASMKSKIKSDRPVVTIEIETEGNVGEIDCKIDLSKPESLDKLNKKVDKAIKEMIEASIQTAKESGSDIFGFGNVVHRDNPKYFKKVEKDWNSQFKELEVEIKVNTELRRKGTATQPINKEG
ncbi:Ger(x)C family spore germination protein [Halobacillus mangrovi]|uniref:Uncharacterized protein n=1 Tax=Halobacillus mangrovi TaxID=402384 RepID=A0A1W5ZRD7_9BACI|nr:Ger(x)C family spore germination protein [Halobacillus mangrovi]ARI75845.1 hypothetical protein HM131_02950 [Halobacillus mangrovi]